LALDNINGLIVRSSILLPLLFSVISN